MLNFIREHEFTQDQKNLIEEHLNGDADIVLLDKKSYDWGEVFVIESRTAFAPSTMLAFNTFDESCKTVNLVSEAFDEYQGE